MRDATLQGCCAMGGRSKEVAASDYCMMVWNGTHPLEGLEVLAKRRFDGGGGFLEALILPIGHLLRFHHADICVSESLWPVSRRRTCDDAGVLGTLWGESEGEMDHQIAGALSYWGTLEPDLMDPLSFEAQWKEIEEVGRGPESLCHAWGESDHRWLSVIEVTRKWREFHVGCFHLHAPSGLVVRSNSVFEVFSPSVEVPRAGQGTRPA